MWHLVLLIVMVAVAVLVFTRHSGFTLKEIPKTIWTFWDSNDIPNFVSKSIDSWRRHSPGFTINVVTPSNFTEYFTDEEIKIIHEADSGPRKSDYVRLFILADKGGIWSDASMVATRSHDWIIDEQKSKGFEFFGYDREYSTTRPEYPALESWFFACIPKCDFVMKWRDEFLRMRSFATPADYIEDLKKKEVDFQSIPMPEYLAVYLSAQHVMQKQMTPEEVKQKLRIVKSDNGPFRHSIMNNWDPAKAMRSFCDQPSSDLPDLIKIYGNERNAMVADPSLQCANKIFERDVDGFQL
jgi:Capsular polysaccharide synthesis protein